MAIFIVAIPIYTMVYDPLMGLPMGYTPTWHELPNFIRLVEIFGFFNEDKLQEFVKLRPPSFR
jgi:hypothetical protein